MLKSYFKIAIRNLLRYKVYSFINIAGLAVGICCCFLIMLFVRSEFSYDKFHSKSGRLFRVWQHEKYEGQDFINTVTPIPMATALSSDFPQVEAACRIYSFNPIVKVNNSSFSEAISMVDSSFFRLFDFELLQGNKQNPFPETNSVLITEETARKYFGKTNPIGKTIAIKLDNENNLFSVAGIIKQAPQESSIKYKLLIPFSNSKYIFRPGLFRNWFNVFLETYVLLKENSSPAELEKMFPAMMKRQLGEDYKEGGFLVHLQPITDIHLNTSLPAGIEPISNPRYSYILTSVGILILLVACINFITLSVGRSATRAMEVGVRKVLGAERQQLIRQFWGEALVLTVLSVMIGGVISLLLINPFNQLINRQLNFSLDLTTLLFIICMILLIAIIAGIYPAVVLSGFKPVEILKGKLNMKKDAGWLRKGLIIGQFVTSISMLICTIGIGQQMNYLNNKDLGYKKDQTIIVQTNKPRAEGLKLAELYRTRLLQQPEVDDVAVSLYSFAETPWVELGFTDDKKVYKSFQFNSISPDFIPAMGVKVSQGRNFSSSNVADQTTSAIVNEAFIKEFGITDPIGKKLPGPFDQHIIGVVRDFHYMSLHKKIEPLLLTISPDSVFRRTENISMSSSPEPRLSIPFKTGNLAGNLALLEKTWKSIQPDQDFEYSFLEDTIATQYREEKKASAIIRIASGLSILIACIGLFGLVTLTVTRRTKEIGIRKVLGASAGSVVALLSIEFLWLIIAAAVIAFPLAWWAINSWLKDFPYRIQISWWAFVIAGLAVVLTGLVTVGFQALKAAWANPVKSLRTE
jgi:putative ABC transport system permease protein